MSPDTLNRSIHGETAGSDRIRASHLRRRLAQLFRLLTAVLAFILIVLFLLSSLDLIDWQRLGQQLGPPWDSLINPYLAPKTVLLLAGEGLIYLALWTTALILGRPVARAILGEARWSFSGEWSTSVRGCRLRRQVICCSGYPLPPFESTCRCAGTGCR